MYLSEVLSAISPSQRTRAYESFALQRYVLVFLQAKLTALWEILCSISTKDHITPATTRDSPLLP